MTKGFAKGLKAYVCNEVKFLKSNFRESVFRPFFVFLVQYGESNSTGLPEIKRRGGLYRFGEVLIDRKGKNQFPCRF